jgi:hypothetical protein
MTKAAAARAAAEIGVRGLVEDPVAVREELRRITESAVFRSSKRSQEFLDYTVTQALGGHAGELKERLIGSALFGRPADYDTGADSIVRVVANETRRRLQQFYQDEGQGSATRIELPSGAYVPQLHRVEQPPAVVPAALIPVRPRRSARPVAIWVLAGIAVALAAGCVTLLLQKRALVAQLTQRKVPDVLPWSALFQGNRGIHIVLADTSVGGVQSLLKNRLPLSDYINGRFIPNEAAQPEDKVGFYRYLISNQFTSASYAITGIHIAQLAQSYGAPVTVSYAREMSLRTFKGGENFVVLGTSRANPWAQLFEPQLNFVLEFEDAAREPWFRNRAPRAGETAIYSRSDQREGLMRESYGQIAFLPALYQGGSVLFVTGTNSQATEAAGEFLTDTERLKSELAKAGIGGAARQFEVLLRVRHTAGAPVRSDVIAVR